MSHLLMINSKTMLISETTTINTNNKTVEFKMLNISSDDDEIESNKQAKMIPKITLLALLFGMGSWIAITGLWLEMPLLIQKLPEGWRLASHLNIMIQFANIGPLIYWYAHRKRLVNEISATHIQLCVGMVSCGFLIIGWDKTLILFNEHEHSVVLFVATFGLALVDCTSSVTFLPFMARFDSSYMTPYLVGEGLSGFIPSMVALLQGVGENHRECSVSNDVVHLPLDASGNSKFHNLSSLLVLDTEVLEKSTISDNQAFKLIKPRFSVEVFFFSLFFTILISYMSFCALQFLPICRKVMDNTKRKRKTQKSEASKDDVCTEQPLVLSEENENENHQEEQQQQLNSSSSLPVKFTTDSTNLAPISNSIEMDSISLKSDDDIKSTIMLPEVEVEEEKEEMNSKNRISLDHVVLNNHKLV